MKKTALAIVLGILVLGTATAELRFDVGAEVPLGFGAISAGSTDAYLSDLVSSAFLVLPEASAYWEFSEGGALKAGFGVRAFTLVLASAFWPNAFIEADLGPLAIEAQLGGGLFGLMALGATDFTAGAVFFPDVSAWLKVGKSFRLGGGAIGLFLPGTDLSTTLPFIFYLGGKFVIRG